MRKSKRESGASRWEIAAFVFVGMFFSIVGLYLIAHPCPYVNVTVTEKGSSVPMVMADNDTPIVGVMILSLGIFTLWLARLVKSS